METENSKNISTSLPAFTGEINPPTTEQPQHDAGYHKAQQLLQSMLEDGLISLSEFNKITALNRKTFSPYLAEIIPKITG